MTAKIVSTIIKLYHTMLNITTKYIPKNTQRRSGIPISGVAFICSHDTGNDGSLAIENVNWFIASANEMQASAHYFVDDKDILCCVPETEKAWGVRYCVPKDNEIYGKDANDWAIHIELCYDSTNKGVDNLKAYNNYVDLHADICKRYKLNPDTDIVGHYVLDPTRRTDPLNAFKYVGKDWPKFIADIKKVMTPVVIEIPVIVPEVPVVEPPKLVPPESFIKRVIRFIINILSIKK
jgi:N-acetylmuramoyl-L-alanine amidase CwlA